MIAGLRALTSRGRNFLIAAPSISVLALLIGEKDLVRVASLLALLPLATAVLVARQRVHLHCTRTLQPVRISVGGQVRVTLRVVNDSKTSTGTLLVEDQVPRHLMSEPDNARFLFERMRSGEHTEAYYLLAAAHRGRYSLGPLRVRITDPFGMVWRSRSFAITDQLTVTPAVTPLSPAFLSGNWGGFGDRRTHTVALHGDIEAAVRQYRHGDDLRRVHWRSTARTGELMVRREEQPWRTCATIVLDSRASAHRGSGAAGSFEWAVSAVASLAVHLEQLGFEVVLAADTSIVPPAGNPAAGKESSIILDYLATAGTVKRTTMTGTQRLGERRGSHRPIEPTGVLVTVTGALTQNDVDVLRQEREMCGTAIAILLDVESWHPKSLRHSAMSRSGAISAHAAAELLANAGWRTIIAHQGAALDSLWAELGNAPVTTGSQP